MISIAECTAKNVAKTLGLKLDNSSGLINVIENERTVWSFGNWVECSAFLLGVCYGEGRGSGKSVMFADWLKRMKEDA